MRLQFYIWYCTRVEFLIIILNKMFFFALIGCGVFIYGLFYTVVLCLLDCDLQLAFYEKFGKSVRKHMHAVLFLLKIICDAYVLSNFRRSFEGEGCVYHWRLQWNWGTSCRRSCKTWGEIGFSCPKEKWTRKGQKELFR